MTLVYVETIIDHLDREWMTFHAPSSSRPGRIHKVRNLIGTDIWSCSCEAFAKYKNPCRHVPNGVEPPRDASSSSAPTPLPSAREGMPRAETGEGSSIISEKLMTLKQMIEDLASRDSTFRRWCIERKSGPFVVRLLNEFYGLTIKVPKGESTESYLMSLPQFSTIRTAVYEVRRQHQINGDELWVDPDPGAGDAMRENYSGAVMITRDPGTGSGQVTFEVGDG